MLLEKETKYVNLRVEEDNKRHHHLVFLPNKGSQGIWNPEEPRALISNYLKCSLSVLGAFPTPPRKVLFIGLGPGIFPMFLHHHFPEMQIHIVEIDEDIVSVAKSHFGFQESKNMTVTIADGRVFINQCREKYDMIYLDAYNAYAIPFHLTTLEFFKKLNGCLNEDGILAINIAHLGKRKFIASELLTLTKVFKYLAVYVTPGNTNYVPLASRHNPLDPQIIAKRVKDLNSKYSFNIDTQKYLDGRLSPEDQKKFIGDDTIVLTDDFAPVNEME